MPTIEQPYDDAVLNLAVDTLALKKQALVFCNTKRGAESQAERIAAKYKDVVAEELAERVLKAVGSPTKQCRRLAQCVRKGVAFHHAGLASKQRELIETAFRDGTIIVICATPTLAMGVDMPAYRSIIRDYKRFAKGTSWGMSDIPVLEYEQMAGRAGRPGKEDKGEAILIAKTEGEQELLIEKYVHGSPEDIYSKLAVEPVLRTYVLSLIASGYVHDTASLEGFFGETFYAFQYGDIEKLSAILGKMSHTLGAWGFLESARTDEFVSAHALAKGTLAATRLGERVAQLYLDPYTAHHLLETIAKARGAAFKDLPLLHMLCTTLEMRPLSNVRQAELPWLDALLVEVEDDLLVKAPGQYSHEYEEFLQSLKTAAVLNAWISEEGEDAILEKYGVTPGELQGKRQIADWLLYALIELSKLMGWQDRIAQFTQMRIRLEHGAKEELLALLRLKGIGRIRGRTLYRNGIRSLGDVKQAEYSALRALLGERIAADIKRQVGQEVRPEELATPKRKRKGQVNLGDFSS